MEPERWQVIERLCHAALEMEAVQRDDYLNRACSGDESLRREVESLLAQEPGVRGFMSDPAIEAAAKALAKKESDSLKGLAGLTIAHYRIIEKIGHGGMGQVFLADDTSLDRKVALKFLTPEMQQDSAARKRLLREAHSAAVLDNPYICSIHEVGEFEGKDFIVMEHVDGQTLREKLRKGPVPLNEALQIAAEVAEALESAHAKGIIHRDLKPANIMLSRSGHAKVMDFGLAKQVMPVAGTDSSDKSLAEVTLSGVTPGTLEYMSPEQLRGEAVDSRSDVFSYGIVLYEILTGLHPFKRNSAIETASAILKEPYRPVEKLRTGIPASLQRLLSRVLAKDPDERYRSLGDLRTELSRLRPSSEGIRWWKRVAPEPLYWVTGVALAAVCSAYWVLPRLLSDQAALPTEIVPVTTFAGSELEPALSPDGTRVAFRWKGERQDNWDIYVKELDGAGLTRLTTDTAVDCLPVWSPNGRRIAFLRGSGMRRSLFVASALGGGEQKLAETLIGPLSWSPDGDTIAFIDSNAPEEPWSIWVLSLSTREKRQITFPKPGWCGDAEPSFSPSGRYLAFVRRRELVRSALYVTPFPSGEPKFVTDRDSPEAPCWTEDGREIVFATEPATGQSSLWRIYSDGKRLRRIAARGEHIYRPSISGHRLVYAIARGNSDIWKIEGNPDRAVPASSPLIAWSSNELESRISPDGSRLAFVSDSSGNPEVWTCSADGRNEFKVTEMKASMTGSPDWSPDGKWITYDSTAAQNQDIYVISADGGRARQLTTDTTDEVVPRWSRDGRWIYFGSNRNGSWQIWKIPSLGGSPVQITSNGGLSARESLDGLFLYYSGYYEFQKRGIWRVPISGGPETMVLDRASYEPLDWDVTDRGIFFIDPGPAATISWFSFVTRSVSSLGRVHSDPAFQPSTLSASADGKSFLCSGGIATSDIMLIDNFR